MTDATDVIAYLYGNGTADGFLTVTVHGKPKGKIHITGVDVFKRRNTQRAIFNSTIANDEMIAIYDPILQHQPTGLIRSAYLILLRSSSTGRYLNLSETRDAHDIASVIKDLRDEQDNVIEQRVRRLVMAYHITNKTWSGLVPIEILEGIHGNFTIPAMSRYLKNVRDTRSCIVPIENNLGDHDNFLGIFDEAQHNDQTYDCPYIVFRLTQPYKVESMNEDNVMEVAEVIAKLRTEVPGLSQ